MWKTIDEFVERKSILILIGITFLGAVLRIYHINYQSLWLDELYSIVPTDPNNSLRSIIEYCKSDQPPFFFIFIHYAFKLFGYNELVGRVSCAILGIISIPVMYFVGRECGDKKVGLFAALLTAINYFNIYYSQELRFYSMAFLMSALSYLFFIRSYKFGSIWDFAGYIVFTVCLLYTHYFGMIIFFTQGITFLFLLKYKRDWGIVTLAVVSALLIVIAFGFWLPIIFSGLGEVLTHIKLVKPYFFIQYYYYYLGKDALSAVTLGFLVTIFLKNFFSRKESNASWKPIYLILMVWLIVSYLIPYLRSLMISPMLVDRYTIVTLPAWILMFAIGWQYIRSVKWRYVAIIVLIASAIANLFLFRDYYNRITKDQWREVSNFVLEKNGDKVSVYSNHAWHFSFYFRNALVKPIYIDKADLSKVDRFWLLLAHLTDEEMEAQISLLHNYRIIERHVFSGSIAVFLERKSDDN